MERRFLLPVTIAAVVHLGLLWLPGASAPSIVASSPRSELIDAFRFLSSPEPAPLDPSDDPPAAATAATEPVPRLPEPSPVTDSGAFPLPRPTPSAPHSPTDAVRLPLGDFPAGPGQGDGPPGSGLRIFGPGELENTPRTRAQSSPVYPFEAKRDGREGAVTVEFIVDETGAVLTPRVVASTDRIFDEPALRAVARWKFEPGRHGGHAVRFRMAVPIVFTLNSN